MRNEADRSAYPTARRVALLGAAVMPLLAAACASGPEPAVVNRAPAEPVTAPHAPASALAVPVPVRTKPRAPVRLGAVGIASWYGKRYHGRKTASGERFDMNAATAAHPSLPFGSLVRVTNLANGRNIVVRINDRGPFVRGRIIDVSRRGAEALGFIRAGVARVRVEVVRLAQG